MVEGSGPKNSLCAPLLTLWLPAAHGWEILGLRKLCRVKRGPWPNRVVRKLAVGGLTDGKKRAT
jgi:hypothetical protein